MVSVTIVGASGYTGGELLRILANHPKVDGIDATSRTYAGKPIASVHKNLYGALKGDFIEFKSNSVDSDVVFLAVPHGESMNIAPKLFDKGIKIVDLSADYRIKEIGTYEKFYKKHESPELVEKAVYGLPELFRKDIKKAQLVANPGCYVLSAILGIAPLSKLKCKIETDKIVVDSKSGTSGAGVKPSEFLHHAEMDENLKPYKVVGHRHKPEMESILSQFFGSIKISFTPTLMPVLRGILTNIHAFTDGNPENLKENYENFYKDEYFVRVVETPYTKNVANTNFCDIGTYFDESTNRIVVISAIDNLVKGASGNAVQNMNLMLGIDEKAGLKGLAGHP